jgi:hypothetical protein
MFQNERVESDAQGFGTSSGSFEGFRWRAWPCRSCGGGVAASDFLRRGKETGRSFQDAYLDPEQIARGEADLLLGWISSCEHTEWREFHGPKIDEGSEHLVFLESATGLVWKLTRPGVYGDSYYLVNGLVNQRNCSPLEYLIRLELWEKLFGVAPKPIGMTNLGQILSTDSFIPGVEPTQPEADEFLSIAGMVPVKQSCWLWKKNFSNIEIWIGDARADNFVKAAEGIVPIDLRIWTILKEEI